MSLGDDYLKKKVKTKITFTNADEVWDFDSEE